MRVTTEAWHGNGSCNPQAAGWAGEGNLAERSDCVPERKAFEPDKQLSPHNGTRVLCGRHLIDAHLLSVAILASECCQTVLSEQFTGSVDSNTR